MTNSTIEILTSINKSVSTIVTYMSPKNGDTARAATAKLNTGNVASGEGDGLKKNLKLSTIKEFIDLISGIPAPIKAVARLSGKTMKNFKTVMEDLAGIVIELDKAGKKVNKKNIENALNPINQIVSINKSFAMMLLVAPVAILGVMMTYPLIIMYIGLLKIIEKFGNRKETNNALRGMMHSIHLMMRVLIEGMLLVGLCIALGALIFKGDGKKLLLQGLLVLGATMIALTAIIILTGLAGRIVRATGAINGVKEIMLLALASFFLVGLCIAFGALMKGDMWALLGNGFAVLGATLIALTVMVLMVGLVAKFTQKTGAIKNVAIIIGVTLATMGIIVAASYLGKFVIKNYKTMSTGLLWTGLVLTAIVAVAWGAGKLASKAKKGAIALAIIEGVALGAMLLIFLAAKLSDKIKDRYGEISVAMLMVMGVITAFGLLAAAASLIAPEILAGTVAIGAVTLMAIAATRAVGKIIELDKKKEEAKMSWEQLGNDVLAINALIGIFGLTAAAFSLLTVPILIAMPAIALTMRFAKKSMGVIKDLLELTVAMDKAGGASRLKKTISQDIPSILKGFKKENFKIDMSLKDIWQLNNKYSALARLARHFLSTAEVVSKIANIGTMTEGGLLKPVLAVNKETGEIIYGDPVDIVGVATVICDTMKVFVESMNYSFEDVSRIANGAMVFQMIGSITTPISSLIQMLTGYVGGEDKDNNYTLTPVSIDSNGKVQYGAPVPVKKTAEAIASAITVFVAELFSEQNASKWSEYVYGDRTTWQKIWGKTNNKVSSVKEIGGILGLFISPVADFVECLSKFEAGEAGHLKLVTIDQNGKPQSGGDVDVAAIAKTLGEGVSTFVAEIFKIQESNKKVDCAYMESICKCVGSLNKTFSDLANNKNIDTERLSEIYKNFDKGSESILRVGGSIKSFDNVIYKEKENRKKTIEELAESIENLLAKFKDIEGVATLNNLLNTLSSMNTDKINENVDAINTKAKSRPSGGSTFDPFNKNSKDADDKNNSPVPSLTEDQIISAIKSALDGVSLNSVYVPTLGTKMDNPLLLALQQLDFTISAPSKQK